MSRSHGFLEEAVTEIYARPGQSANEIARRLLDEGRATSTAENPIGSLVATLHKHHFGKSVRREWREGQYRYYPRPEPQADEANALQSLKESSVHNELEGFLPKDCLEDIDALVRLPQFNSRHDVMLWLIRKGMESIRVR